MTVAVCDDTLTEIRYTTLKDTTRPAPSYAEPSQQGGFILVASDNPGSDPIGFAHVLDVPEGSHLEQLSVRPSAAHRGHGRSLVEAVKSESRLRGCKRITLRTFADVPWNAPFYVSCGFIERGPDSDFLRDLLIAEQQQGLGFGRRVQMNFDLTDELSRFSFVLRAAESVEKRS